MKLPLFAFALLASALFPALSLAEDQKLQACLAQLHQTREFIDREQESWKGRATKALAKANALSERHENKIVSSMKLGLKLKRIIAAQLAVEKTKQECLKRGEQEKRTCRRQARIELQNLQRKEEVALLLMEAKLQAIDSISEEHEALLNLISESGRNYEIQSVVQNNAVDKALAQCLAKANTSDLQPQAARDPAAEVAPSHQKGLWIMKRVMTVPSDCPECENMRQRETESGSAAGAAAPPTRF